MVFSTIPANFLFIATYLVVGNTNHNNCQGNRYPPERKSVIMGESMFGLWKECGQRIQPQSKQRLTKKQRDSHAWYFSGRNFH